MSDVISFPNIALVGSLVGDPVRAAIISALMDGSERPAGELAFLAGTTPQAASAHLGRLVDGGLLVVRVRGRFRYYRLRDDDVARAIETLSLAADGARQKARSLDPALRMARRCYDHLAGRLGIAICDALVRRSHIIAGAEGFAIGPAGRDWLARYDLSEPRDLRRAVVRPCLDWTERKYHLAGWLGAALCERLENSGALRRMPNSRAFEITPVAQSLLWDYFGLDWSK
jgi:DNA-binding transcriptional ArsR family regulator